MFQLHLKLIREIKFLQRFGYADFQFATMWICQGAEHPNICSENSNSVY